MSFTVDICEAVGAHVLLEHERAATPAGDRVRELVNRRGTSWTLAHSSHGPPTPAIGRSIHMTSMPCNFVGSNFPTSKLTGAEYFFRTWVAARFPIGMIPIP